MTCREKIFWITLWLICGVFPVFGQEIINETTIRDGNVLTIFSGPQYYQLSDGSWGIRNPNFYTRETPTASGYTLGLWTDKNIIELPDSLNAMRFIKIRDRQGNFFAFRPIGFARYIGGEVDVQNVIKFSSTLNGVSTEGNTLTYYWGTGSTLRLIYTTGTLKQELIISEIDRRRVIQMVPNASHIGIIYEYARGGDKYHIAVDAGTAWTPDSTFYPVYDLTKIYAGKNYWLSGVTWNAFRDTTGHPGAFTIDPAIVDSSMVTSGMDGSVTSDAGDETKTYTAVRNSTTNVKSVYTSQITVGQNITTVPWIYTSISRGFLKFLVPDFSGIVLDSVKLVLDGESDLSNSDFNMNVYSAIDSAGSWLTTATGFNKFTGWQKTGTYTKDTLATGLWSGKYSDGYDNVLKFTSAGLDTVLAHSGDTLHLALLSDDDVNADSLFYRRQMRFSSSSSANKPKLMYYYMPHNVYAPDSLAFSSLTDSSAVLDSIAGNLLDISTVNKFAIYNTSIGMYLDTTQTAPFKKTRQSYVKSAWNNKLYPFPRDYVTRFIIEAFGFSPPDSLKTTSYNITIGNPAVSDTVYIENQGRWNPAIDKIQ